MPDVESSAHEVKCWLVGAVKLFDDNVQVNDEAVPPATIFWALLQFDALMVPDPPLELYDVVGVRSYNA